MASRFLASRKEAIVARWLDRTLQDYDAGAGRFITDEKDRFLNPAGHMFRESLPALYEALLAEGPLRAIHPELDAVIRLRAVQDFSAARAVAFVFSLKDIVRDEAIRDGFPDAGSAELMSFERRIDELALVAFDMFMKCREEIWSIKARERDRRTYVNERFDSRKDR